MEEVKTKVCPKCKREFPATEEFFPKRKDSKDGLRNKCKNCMKKYRKQNNINLKLLVISHYGGRCAVCGEATLAFLTIDHINNNGAEERKKEGTHGGYSFYLWLICNDFPPGFQVLCWNHNFLKYFNFVRLNNKNTPDCNKTLKCNHKRKLKVISYYDGKCKECGETNLDLLTIDHINNDGAEHRKETGSGIKMYQYLVRKGFPPGFQVLCFNHNCGKED